MASGLETAAVVELEHLSGALRQGREGRLEVEVLLEALVGIDRVAGVPVLGQRRLALAAEELDDLPVDDLVDHHAVRDGVAASACELADQPLDHAVRHLVGVGLVAQPREAAAEDDLVVGGEQRRVVTGGEQAGVLGVSLIPHPRGSRVGHRPILRALVRTPPVRGGLPSDP